ncbi:MAG: dihydrolipoamide acetyltransferase family protein [Candidatus Dormibacteria bacterium]
MAYQVTMPQMGYDMTEGSINRWLVEEGAKVERGDVIASIATEKADIDIEAYASGVLRKILVAPGTKVPVGQPIAVIAEPEEELAPAEEAPPPPPPPPAEAETPSEEAEPAEPAGPTPVPDWARTINAGARTEVASPPAGQGPRVKASPLARRRARELGVALEAVAASGPSGRIRAEDVEAAWGGGSPSSAGAAPGPDGGDPSEAVPLSRMREAIARRMAEAKATIPHFYLSTEVEVEPLLRLRSELNQLGEAELPHFSVTDFLIRALGLTLQRHPALNAAWVGDGVRRYQQSNIALAVALPDGLVAPVLRGCQALTFAELSRRAHDLAARAKANQLRPEELSGGHTAISNLGMFGVSQFAAIITPGQGSVLAVGEVRELAVVRAGAVVPGQRLALTLALDHRVIDGAQGAEALAYLRWCLEHPTACLL